MEGISPIPKPAWDFKETKKAPSPAQAPTEKEISDHLEFLNAEVANAKPVLPLVLVVMAVISFSGCFVLLMRAVGNESVINLYAAISSAVGGVLFLAAAAALEFLYRIARGIDRLNRRFENRQ